jgi:hypothetical protein
LFAEKYAEELESPYTLPQRRRQLLESSRLHQQLLQLAGGEAAHLLRRIPRVSAADVSGGRAAKNNTTYFPKFSLVSSNVYFVKLAKFREVVFREIFNNNGTVRNKLVNISVCK